MTSAWRLPSADLSGRMDAGFYAPEYVELERQLRGSPLRVIALGSSLKRVFKGAFYLLASQYTTSGVPFIRVTQIASGLVDLRGTAFISASTHASQRKTAVAPGYLLFAKGGMYRHSAVVPSSVTDANISQDLIAAEPSKDLDSHYALAAIQSKYGRPQLVRWEQGNAQPHLSNEGVKEFLIAVPHNAAAQRYIGDKVRQAERLRERARRLDSLTFAAFDPLTQSLPSPQRMFRVPSSEVESYRLNPNHFDPVVRAAIHTAKAIARLHALSDLVIDGDIAGGATPLGAQYVVDGIFFARVQNVKPLRLDRSDAAFITAEQDREIVRSRCRPEDVVLSITGYPGTASVVLDEDLPLNINQHSVRFAVRSEFGAGYVAAAINSRFGQLQVGRLAVGGTRDALDYTSVRSLLIPEFSSEVREAINAQVRTASLCVRAAQRLVTFATLLVEHLIDSRITEADLVAAQKALEAGDRSADRELLKALRQSDSPDAKSVIADVDALYALLDASEGQDA